MAMLTSLEELLNSKEGRWGLPCFRVILATLKFDCKNHTLDTAGGISYSD